MIWDHAYRCARVDDDRGAQGSQYCQAVRNNLAGCSVENVVHVPRVHHLPFVYMHNRK
jgi:hypothetical protein